MGIKTPEMDQIATAVMSGAIADIPAFGIPGRLYWATDEHILYRDSGAAWVPVGTLDLADMTEKSHASLTSVTANQHHNQAHGNSDHSSLAWTTFTVTSVTQSGARTFTTNHARYCIEGKLARVQVRLTITQAGSAGTEVAVNLPAALTAARADDLVGTLMYAITGVGIRVGLAFTRTTTSIVCYTDASAAALGASPSFATANGDGLWMNLSYELA